MTRYRITKVVKKNAKTGEVLKEYVSPKDAASGEGVAVGTVKNWCNGCKKPSGGYLFEGKKEEIIQGTLCWRCQNACGGCSWSRELKPVEGWTAKRRDINVQHNSDGVNYYQMAESYIVKKCPEFVQDPPRGKKFEWLTKRCVNCSSIRLCAVFGPVCKGGKR